jgi:hypothetical protein
MEKAILLADDSLQGLIDLVNHIDISHPTYAEKEVLFYRLKILIEEYRLQLLTYELYRLNRFVSDERQTVMDESIS